MAESGLTMAEGPVLWLDKRLELQPGLGYEGTTADTWMNATLGLFEEQRKLAREYYAVDPEFAESYAGKVAGAVGAAVPQLVAMRVPIAAVVGIGGQSFLHGWEDAENTAMRRGETFDPNRAYAYATTMAVLNTALTFLEFKMVLGPWKKGQSELLGDNLIKLFQSATGGGAVNAAQGGVNDLGATAFGIETRNPFDPERRWDDFTVGTGAGFVLGAGARMALSGIPETPPRPPLKPGITFVDSLGKQEVPVPREESLIAKQKERTDVEPEVHTLEGQGGLTIEEAVRLVKENPHHIVTEALTAWFGKSHIRIQSGKLTAYRHALKDFLLRLPTFEAGDRILYRGVRFDTAEVLTAFLRQFSEGAVWKSDRPFMSVSIEQGVAHEFAYSRSHSVVLEIRKSHSARDIAPFAFLDPQYAFQRELLYADNAVFKVLEITKVEVDGRTAYNIVLEEQ